MVSGFYMWLEGMLGFLWLPNGVHVAMHDLCVFNSALCVFLHLSTDSVGFRLNALHFSLHRLVVSKH